MSVSTQWNTEDEDIIVDPKLSKTIAFKIVIVFVFSIVGAILALLINVFMEIKTASPEILPYTKTDEVEVDDEGKLMVGIFHNKNDPSLCLDTWDRPTETSKDNQVITVWPCHQFFAYNQIFTFTKHGEMKQGKYCLEMISNKAEMAKCHNEWQGQFWVWLQDDMLYNPDIKMCLGIGEFSDKYDYHFLESKNCNKSDDTQRWIFELVDVDKMWLPDDEQVEINEEPSTTTEQTTTPTTTTRTTTTTRPTTTKTTRRTTPHDVLRTTFFYF